MPQWFGTWCASGGELSLLFIFQIDWPWSEATDVLDLGLLIRPSVDATERTNKSPEGNPFRRDQYARLHCENGHSHSVDILRLEKKRSCDDQSWCNWMLKSVPRSYTRWPGFLFLLFFLPSFFQTSWTKLRRFPSTIQSASWRPQMDTSHPPFSDGSCRLCPGGFSCAMNCPFAARENPFWDASKKSPRLWKASTIWMENKSMRKSEQTSSHIFTKILTSKSREKTFNFVVSQFCFNLLLLTLWFNVEVEHLFSCGKPKWD